MISCSSSSRIVAAALLCGFTMTQTSAFTAVVVPNKSTIARCDPLKMGILDGAKNAFDAGGMAPGEGGSSSDRETPIDRWFGWSTMSENEKKKEADKSGVYNAPADFIDAMDSVNYASVELQKPMGIVFEENEEKFSGMYILSLEEGSNAEKDGGLQKGDQLVGVGTNKVSGLVFEDAMGAIVDNTDEVTKLVVFRGSARQLYGPTGASQEWIQEFVSSGSVDDT